MAPALAAKMLYQALVLSVKQNKTLANVFLILYLQLWIMKDIVIVEIICLYIKANADVWVQIAEIIIVIGRKETLSILIIMKDVYIAASMNNLMEQHYTTLHAIEDNFLVKGINFQVIVLYTTIISMELENANLVHFYQLYKNIMNVWEIT